MEAFGELLTVQFFLVVAGIFAVIFTIRKSYPQLEKKYVWVKRLMPVFPLFWGAIFMMVVPSASSFEDLGARFMHGLFAGFVAGQFHKIGKQTILAPILERKNGSAPKD